ncbi:hypothetical protein DsansV1_C01g0009961 [Dioscorea sansibarensis]
MTFKGCSCSTSDGTGNYVILGSTRVFFPFPFTAFINVLSRILLFHHRTCEDKRALGFDLFSLRLLALLGNWVDQMKVNRVDLEEGWANLKLFICELITGVEAGQKPYVTDELMNYWRVLIDARQAFLVTRSSRYAIDARRHS